MLDTSTSRCSFYHTSRFQMEVSQRRSSSYWEVGGSTLDNEKALVWVEAMASLIVKK